MSDIEDLKGISRIETNSTVGWYVRVYRNQKTYSKFFSDSKFGGKELSFKKAITQREKLNKMIDKIPKKPTKRRVVNNDKRNKTGVLGVSRTSKKASNGKYYECYTVSWRPKPKIQQSTSFSIKKYGEEKALELAIHLRKEKSAQI
jgi:hypothetical protein